MNTPSIRPLPNCLVKQVAEESNEVPSRIPDELESLREWIKKQNHLTARTDDQFLVAFLRACKHSLERCKERIDSYYSLRAAIPIISHDRDPTHPYFVELFIKGLICPLPIPHPNGFRPIIAKPGLFDVQRGGVMAALKFGFMVCDRYFVEDDYFSIGGYSVLFDMDGFSTKHMAGLTVPTLRELAECMKLGYPIRHRGIHYINCPTGFDVLLRLFRNFLPTKLANVIHTHSDFESVYEHFPKSCLPAEYGGNLGTLREITSDFLEKYLSSREWFDEDSKYRCDETKRQGASRIPNDLFGVDGSFKKLEID